METFGSYHQSQIFSYFESIFPVYYPICYDRIFVYFQSSTSLFDGLLQTSLMPCQYYSLCSAS